MFGSDVMFCVALCRTEFPVLLRRVELHRGVMGFCFRIGCTHTHAHTHTHIQTTPTPRHTHPHTHTNTHTRTCTHSLQKSNPLFFLAQLFCQQVIFWFSGRNKQRWYTRTECDFSVINLNIVVVYIWSPPSCPLLKFIGCQSFIFYQLLAINMSCQQISKLAGAERNMEFCKFKVIVDEDTLTVKACSTYISQLLLDVIICIWKK